MKTAWIVGAILLVGAGLGFLYHSENQRSDILANRAKCAQDGKAWVSSNFQEIPPDTVTTRQNYTYSPELGTCLVDIQRNTLLGMEYEIYDIYGNKEIVGYALNRPDLGLATSTGSQKDYLAAEKKYFGN